MAANTEDTHLSCIERLIQQVQSFFNKEKREEECRYANGEYYNIFDTLGLTTLEVRLHSALLAELLNPKAAHGLGSKPLESFLSVIGEENLNFDIESARVYVEHFIGRISNSGETGGQIDILIEDKHHKAIIIENKINAGDQATQLLRYHNYANQHHKDKYRLIYLTLDGHSPSEYSTGNCDIDHHCISYDNEITDWLNICLDYSADRPLINSVIKQYLTTIDGLMERRSEEYRSKLSDLLRKEDYIDSVLEIIDNSYEVCNKIREDFIRGLGEMAKEEGFKMDYTESIVTQNEGGQWIWFSLPVSDKWAFYLGQDRCGANICYGISIDTTKDKLLPQYKVRKAEQVWFGGEKCQEFPMGWCFLWSETGKPKSGSWCDWNNTGTLRDMRNGKMLDFIRTELQKVKSMRLIEKITELDSTKR